MKGTLKSITQLDARKTLDTLSLLAVLNYAALRFFQSTMFQFYYSDQYKLITMVFLICFGGVRWLSISVEKWKGYIDKKQKVVYFVKSIGAVILALPFVLVGWIHNYKFLIFIPICCMCLYEMEARKVLKAFSLTIGLLLSVVIICCLSGTVRNLVYYIDNERLIQSYGIINTSDFASYFTFILLSIWCSMHGNKWFTSIAFSIFATGISCCVYYATGSLTVLVCTLLLDLYVGWECIDKNVLQRNNRLNIVRKTINRISIWAFPTICITIAVLTVLYGKGNSFALKINELLSDRLKVTWIPYQTYGIHPLGSLVKTMHGSGATSIRYNVWSAGYGYMDVAYAMLAIRYGSIITIIVAGLWMWMTKKTLHNGNSRIAYAMTILVLHGISEARIWDINYNFFLIMPFCSFCPDVSKRGQISCVEEKNKRTLTIFVKLVILVGIVFVFPKLLSWLRTFFTINKWNNGTSAIWSVAVCSGIIVCVYLVLKSFDQITQKRTIKGIAIIGGIVLSVLFGVYLVNNSIKQEIEKRNKEITEVEPIVRCVQDVASQPVYVAEFSEIYQRSFGGFSDHLFSTEELGREPKGSIFVDSDIEAFGIILSGGQYTQITKNCGLYSYDPKVIEAVTEMGYKWEIYYNGIRSCDLRDLAVFNEMNPNEPIVLSEGKRITTKNMETDQFAGVYEVNYSFSFLDASVEGDAVVLEVVGEAGERQICQEIITTDEFVDGKCKKTIRYEISDTPKVSFSVSTKEGISVTVDSITWKRLK